jgi:hypothetical protein
LVHHPISLIVPIVELPTAFLSPLCWVAEAEALPHLAVNFPGALRRTSRTCSPPSAGKREGVGVYLLIPFRGCDLPTGHTGRRYEAA